MAAGSESPLKYPHALGRANAAGIGWFYPKICGGRNLEFGLGVSSLMPEVSLAFYST